MIEHSPAWDPVEIVGSPAAAGPLVVTCEHAGNAIPPPLQPSQADLPWLETHWGWDIGAGEVARQVVAQTGSVGVLARFSRLVCDPNRTPDDPTFVLPRVDGHTLSFNQNLDAAELERRRQAYYEPYHATIDRILGERRAHGGDLLLLAVHSFTPQLGEERREMELGVLFDQYVAIADRMAALMRREGFHTALNEPYSGFDGLMYSAQRHGNAHGVVYLEVEIRQDLLAQPGQAQAVGQRLARAVSGLRLRRSDRH